MKIDWGVAEYVLVLLVCGFSIGLGLRFALPGGALVYERAVFDRFFDWFGIAFMGLSLFAVYHHRMRQWSAKK